MKNLPFRSILSAIAIAVFFVSSRADSAPGYLYVAEGAGGHIYKFSAAGTKSTVSSGISQPEALAFDRAGNLFVGTSGGTVCVPEIDCPPMLSTVIKITPDGTQSTFATFQSSDLFGLAFDGAGNLFVSFGASIVKIAPNGAQNTFASQLNRAGPLAFDTSGNLFVGLLNPGFSSSIAKFAPDGSSTTFVTLPSSSPSITGLAFGPGGDLYVDLGSSILKVRPDGSRSTFATSDRFSYPLAFDASGVLFSGRITYTSTEPAIVKFTSSGAATTFAFGPFEARALAFEPVSEKVRNFSARGLVGGGDNTLIGGFIVGGSALANNAVIVRAIGPSLSRSGVTNPLSDPILELRDSSGAIIASNNDWQDTQKAQITASGLAPTDSHESAIFATLPNGNYTAVVRSADSTMGTAVVEVFSVNQ
jgi:hypothetical protein